MKKMKEKVLKCVIKTAERVAKTGGDGWPPCIGYIYQPKRPVQLKAPKNDVKNTKSKVLIVFCRT